MATTKKSVLISQSRTREQIAQNLCKEGPLILGSLTKTDLLHLVDLLTSDKKWVEENPTQTSLSKSCNLLGRDLIQVNLMFQIG